MWPLIKCGPGKWGVVSSQPTGSMSERAMRVQQLNEEVLIAAEPVVLVSGQDIQSLIDRAAQTERERIRLCAHKSTEDRLHEMFIVHARGTYVPPHKHVNKSESFHIIKGLVDVILFDAMGEITQVLRMGDYQSGLPFYYRIDEALFHTLLIKSDVLVFHETTNGPFNRADTIFADLAPSGTDSQASAEFMTQLAQRASTF